MRLTIFATALVVATAAAAQTPTHAVVTANTFSAVVSADACPVGITASQQGSPVAIWTTSLEDASKPAAELKKLHSGVHVDLNASDKHIKQVELEVFYLPPGTRAVPVRGSQFTSGAPRPETSKKFSLTSGKTPSRQLDGDLLLGPVASITHVSLMNITYADGSEWTAHNSSTCSIKPSLYMPVENK